MENITVENANEMMAKAKISDTTHTKQAAAWVIINQFCHQSGLFHNREDDDLSGIQRVIKYLSETQADNKALKEENTRLTTKFIEEEHAADHPNENLSYWQYQQFTRAAITKLKEELVTTERALQEINNQHQEDYKRLKSALEEIERLKAELKNANSALDNISDMGHA